MFGEFSFCAVSNERATQNVMHVSGLHRCKDGYFGLSSDDPVGCVACFCYGHSSNCTASTDYVVDVIQSNFTTGACESLYIASVS